MSSNDPDQKASRNVMYTSVNSFALVQIRSINKSFRSFRCMILVLSFNFSQIRKFTRRKLARSTHRKEIVEFHGFEKKKKKERKGEYSLTGT